MKLSDTISRPSTAGAPARPLFASPVHAGFPSPADDYIEAQLDLNEHVIRHPAATFFVRAAGDSMTGAGIHHGDILVVDRAPEPRDGDVVIAVLDGELVVKRLKTAGARRYLMPDNSRYAPIELGSETAVEVWGVVTHVIHEL